MFISVRKVNTSKRGENMMYEETHTPLHRLVNSAFVREIRPLSNSEEHCLIVSTPPSGPEVYMAVEGGMDEMTLRLNGINSSKATPHMPPPTATGTESEHGATTVSMVYKKKPGRPKKVVDDA